MKATALKEMGIEDLNKELLESLKELFNLRMQKSAGHLTRSHSLKDVRRKIARIKTVLQAKKKVG